MVGQPGFFDLSDRYAALSAAGDPLERLSAVLDFEVFRGPLIAVLRRSDRGKGGRPPFDPVMMFKILVLQALYSLADEGIEFQIKGRLADPVMPPLDSSVQKLLAGARLPKRSAPACSPTPQPQR